MLVLLLPMSSAAHEIRPALAYISISDAEVELEIRMPLEPVIAGISLTDFENTNDSPLSGLYDDLRTLPPEQLVGLFEEQWPRMQELITLRAGFTDLTPELVTVNVPEVGDVEYARDSRIFIRADLPPDGTPVIAGWDSFLGALIVIQEEGDQYYADHLIFGDLTEPLPRVGVIEQSAGEVFLTYLKSGIDHIIPKGLDHILFVLGVFFFSLAWRPLIWQVSAFTVAHTITLALATLGLVNAPPAIVEPLIALSIAYIAVENILGKGEINKRRVAVVFAFGLLHGLGFASVLGDFGLEQGRFILSLIAFNIGVEIGQLAVIAMAFAAVGYWFGQKPWYRKSIAIPASAAIGVIGLYWTIERVVL